MEKLDNPVWYSLQETHIKFSVAYGNLKCYHPDFCPFGGYENKSHLAAQIDLYSNVIQDFFIVGDKPPFSTSLKLKNNLVCLQMTLNQKIDALLTEEIVDLNGRFENEVYHLVNLVQPGYFKRNTMELGEYCGIFKDGALVAITGERMKMDNFTEISAIVTHPNYTGRGYAKQLIIDRVNKIVDQNKIPFLHVSKSNIAAIQLYLKLGFAVRREISFWNFIRDNR